MPRVRIQDLIVAAVVIGMILMLMVPLPPEMLDVLLALNISVSVITILISIYVRNPLEFAVFPTVLLMATLFRLSLDVSATRLILLHGSEVDASGVCTGVGEVILALGDVVVGGNIVVGIIMFLILVLIQFMVITSGAERIAQVAARFTLDAMPGKSMAIDADLHAGVIDGVEARRRRDVLQRESDFYGAMDGAGKFVKGDAMAAVVIMIVNLVGGIVVGLAYHGQGPLAAFRTYAILSIGNGLVTTLPAFLISTAMGMVVTRAASDANLADDVIDQVAAQPMAVKVASGFMALLALLGTLHLFALPSIPFFALSLMFFFVARHLEHERQGVEERGVEEKEVEKKERVRDPKTAIDLLGVDPLSIEVGRGLLALVDPAQDAKLVERVGAIRRHLAMELGLVVPGVRFRDNLQLRPDAYTIRVRDNPVASGTVMVGMLLAIGPEDRLTSLRGTRTVDNTYGMPGVWITPEQRGEAERHGLMVFDAVSVIATHLTETVRAHAADLVGRQEAQALLDTVRKTHPAVVKELVPDALSLADVQRVLQNLLRERVSIRDLVRILETMGDHVRVTRDPDLLTECVRVSLARNICREYTNNTGEMQVITLDPAVEQVLATAVQHNETGRWLALDPAIGDAILRALMAEVRKLMDRGQQPIVLCAPQVRPAVRKLTERSFPNIVVLSWNEIAPAVSVQPVGMVTA